MSDAKKTNSPTSAVEMDRFVRTVMGLKSDFIPDTLLGTLAPQALNCNRTVTSARLHPQLREEEAIDIG